MLTEQAANCTRCLAAAKTAAHNDAQDLPRMIYREKYKEVYAAPQLGASTADRLCLGQDLEFGGDPASHTPAHNVTATAAPFQA